VASFPYDARVNRGPSFGGPNFRAIFPGSFRVVTRSDGPAYEAVGDMIPGASATAAAPAAAESMIGGTDDEAGP
jgi:hypothetical protein